MSLRSYFWSGLGTYGTQLLGFIGNILVARILLPDDYGLIAMLSIILSVAMTFTDSGFSDCLIRKTDADDLDFGTVAAFNIFIGIFLYIVIFFSAPLIANYYNRPELVSIARVMSIAIIIKASNLNQLTWMRKNILFKELTKMQIITSIISIIFMYIIAKNGFGYWTLALQPVLISLFNFIYLKATTKWKPVFKFSLIRFKEMFSFSSNLLISYLINQIGLNLYSAIIGKFYTVSSLGFYNQARRMNDVTTQGLNSVVLTTSYSLLAQEKNKIKQREMYINMTKSFVTIQTILTFLLIGSAHSLWLILFGQKWINSISYFNLLMIISLVFPLMTVNSNIAKTQDRTSLYRNLTFIRNGLKVLALIVCAKKSIEIIIYGQIMAAYISIIIDMIYCGRLINFNFFQQFKIFAISIGKSLIPFVISMIICNFINVSKYVDGFIFIFLYIIFLFALLYLVKDELFVSSINKFKYNKLINLEFNL
jgi:O-antigen/teichoic acid export membrane protein